jgi:hypothetical protein
MKRHGLRYVIDMVKTLLDNFLQAIKENDQRDAHGIG